MLPQTGSRRRCAFKTSRSLPVGRGPSTAQLGPPLRAPQAASRGWALVAGTVQWGSSVCPGHRQRPAAPASASRFASSRPQGTDSQQDAGTSLCRTATAARSIGYRRRQGFLTPKRRGSHGGVGSGRRGRGGHFRVCPPPPPPEAAASRPPGASLEARQAGSPMGSALEPAFKPATEVWPPLPLADGHQATGPVIPAWPGAQSLGTGPALRDTQEAEGKPTLAAVESRAGLGWGLLPRGAAVRHVSPGWEAGQPLGLGWVKRGPHADQLPEALDALQGHVAPRHPLRARAGLGGEAGWVGGPSSPTRMRMRKVPHPSPSGSLRGRGDRARQGGGAPRCGEKRIRYPLP